jgi:hypothetical protein
MNFYEFFEMLENASAINRKDPVRDKVARIETYWPKPGLALSAIQEILFSHGYLIPYASFSVHDKAQEHTERFNIERKINPDDPNSATEDTGSSLIFSWHWMPSGGQVEITAYIS